MSTFEVYGVKKIFILYLCAALFTFLSGVAMVLCGYFLSVVIAYYPAAFFLAGGIYIGYLAYHEGFSRYEKFVKTPGQNVEAVLSHFDSRGQISVYLQAEAMIDGKLVQGRLYGTFGPSFLKAYDDGSKVKVRYLSTGEFLMLQKQD